MSTTEARTTVGAMHMRLVYFSRVDRDGLAPVTPGDLTRVFRQLDLLVEYARSITPRPQPWAPYPPYPAPEFSRETLLPDSQEDQEAVKRALVTTMKRLKEKAAEAAARLESGDLEGLSVDDVLHDELWRARPDVLPRAGWTISINRPASDEQIAVIALRMGSPLEVLVAIPLIAWPGIAIGLLALAERVTTMPVRITRKRKAELLKIAILDKQTQLVKDGQADVLAKLLLEEGPERRPHAPDEIVFLDPDEPEDELEAA